MAETSQGSDMAIGLGILFGLIVVVASIATAVTSYSSFVMDDGDAMQLLSGLTLSVALIAGCIAIVAIHLYE